MKTKGFLGIAFCLLSWMGLQAQQKPAAASTMKFAEESWDFGTIKEEAGPVSHTFTFTNTGQDPFVIERVTTTCGCTTPEYTREPILPGRKGTVKVTYNPDGRPGPFQKTITVTSHNSANQNQIHIKGEVTGRVRTPEEQFPVAVGAGLRVERQSVGLGYLPRGGTKSIAIDYMNDSPAAITLDAAYERPNSYFSVAFSAKSVPAGGRGTMTLAYDLRQADVWGRLSDDFAVTVNGKATPVRFSATGIATEDYADLTLEQIAAGPKADFSSQYYHFGDTRAGTLRKRDFTLTNNGRKPLTVQYVKAGEHMTITLKTGTILAPGQSVSFSATLDTKDFKAGRCMDNAVVILNDPQRPMREIRLAATIL